MSTSAHRNDPRSCEPVADAAIVNRNQGFRYAARRDGAPQRVQAHFQRLIAVLSRTGLTAPEGATSAARQSSDDQLVREQFTALARLIPFWYQLLSVMSVFYIFFNIYMWKSPFGYAVIILSEVFMLYRAVLWRRISKNIDAFDLGAMKAKIDRTFWMIPLMDGPCVILTCGLLADIRNEHKIFVVVIIITTAIVTSSIFAITPKIAFATLGVCFAPIIIVSGVSKITTLQYSAAPILILGLGQTWMVWRQFRNYRQIVESRERLKEAQSRLEAAEEAARMQAYTDFLTGVRNRRILDALMAEGEEASAQCFAVAAIDLDGFKAVNDHYGHPAGDALLKLVAQRLHNQFSDIGELVRLGGDEFALICQEEIWFPLLQDALDEALDDLKRPYFVLGRSIHIGASIGLCVGDRGEGLDRVMAAADRTLYEVKRAGKGYSKLADRQAEVDTLQAAATRSHESQPSLRPRQPTGPSLSSNLDCASTAPLQRQAKNDYAFSSTEDLPSLCSSFPLGCEE